MRQQRNNTLVRFDEDIDNLLRAMAKGRNCTISKIVREAVLTGLADEFDVGIDEDGKFFYNPK